MREGRASIADTKQYSCTNCPNPVASPTSTITYTVTALLQNQCIQTDEVTVSVLTDSDIDAGEDITVCAGFPVTLNGSYPFGTSLFLLKVSDETMSKDSSLYRQDRKEDVDKSGRLGDSQYENQGV